MKPLISVLLPVRNGEKFLEEALGSLFAQSFPNFEILLLDDASDDGTPTIAAAIRDPRLRYLRAPTPWGISRLLNWGIRLAKGCYLARMDADDIALPWRFERQVTYMENHQEISISGAFMVGFGRQNRVLHSPLSHDMIMATMFFQNALNHPTVFLRQKDILGLGFSYDPEYACSQDYDFWIRAGRRLKLGNLGEILVRYRVHEMKETLAKEEKKRSCTRRIFRRQLDELGVVFSEKEFALHDALCHDEFSPCHHRLEEFREWLEKLQTAGAASNIFSSEAFQQVLRQKWLEICSQASFLGSQAWRTFLRFSDKRGFRENPWGVTALILRCLLRYEKNSTGKTGEAIKIVLGLWEQFFYSSLLKRGKR